MSLLIKIESRVEKSDEKLLDYFIGLRNDNMGVGVEIMFDDNGNYILNDPMLGASKHHIHLKVDQAFILPLDISIEGNYNQLKTVRIKINSYSSEEEWRWGFLIAKGICKLMDCNISIYDNNKPIFEKGQLNDFNIWYDHFSAFEYRSNEFLALGSYLKNNKIKIIGGINRPFYIGKATIEKIFSKEFFLNEYWNMMHFVQYPPEQYFIYDRIRISSDGERKTIVVFVINSMQPGIVFNDGIEYLLFLDKNVEASSNLIRVECNKVRMIMPEEYFIDENSFLLHYGATQHWNVIIKKAKEIANATIKNDFYPLF